MSTETQTQQETQQTQAAETKVEKEVTLDDVYRDAGLDKVEQRETQQAQQTQQVQQKQEVKVDPSSIPDPYDAENFKGFMARQAAGTTELMKAVNEISGFLNAKAQQDIQVATRADIDKAVQAMDEVVGIGKPKVIEAYLDGMVREDPRMKAIWNARAKNPAAWQSAVQIAAKKMAEDFSVKVDPALVAAQRARKESQKQMATTAESNVSPMEERLAAAQGVEFDIEWQKLLGHG